MEMPAWMRVERKPRKENAKKGKVACHVPGNRSSLTASGELGAAWDSRGFSAWQLGVLIQGLPSHQGLRKSPVMNVGARRVPH